MTKLKSFGEAATACFDDMSKPNAYGMAEMTRAAFEGNDEWILSNKGVFQPAPQHPTDTTPSLAAVVGAASDEACCKTLDALAFVGCGFDDQSMASACAKGFSKSVEKMLGSGLVPDIFHVESCRAPSGRDDSNDLIPILVGHPLFDASQANKALLFAAKMGSVSGVSQALAIGAEPDFENGAPLVQSLLALSAECAAVLLQAGADPSVGDGRDLDLVAEGAGEASVVLRAWNEALELSSLKTISASKAKGPSAGV